MKLGTLVDIAESGPWCGTKPPGHVLFKPKHGPGPGPQFMVAAPHPLAELEPSPQPWRNVDEFAALCASIKLYQISRLLPAKEGKELASAAEEYFDEYCGNGWQSWIYVILHFPPPNPPPWVEEIALAAQMLEFGSALPAGEMKKQITQVASQRFEKALGVLSKSELAAG